jgi:hypothetical protein
LLERLDPFFHLALQLGKRDHAVVYLRDYFIDDHGFPFLGVRERRRNDEGS